MSDLSTSQYCLRWNNHRSNLLTVFDQLLENGSFTDVTLAVDDGKFIQCHKIVLAACSTYFQRLFHELPDRAMMHPIVVLKDVSYSDIRAILQYMYRGEVNVAQEQLNGLLHIANVLKVKGLVQENDREEEYSTHDFRRREATQSTMPEIIQPSLPSPPPAISTSTGTGTIVHNSDRVSPSHSLHSSYENSTVHQNHIASLPYWPSGQSLLESSLMGQPMRSGLVGGTYRSYEISPQKRPRKAMQPLHVSSHTKELRKALDLSYADSSQDVPPLSDSQESIHYCDDNSPTSVSNCRTNIDFSARDTHSFCTDEDEKQPPPQSAVETKLGIANHPSTQPKPEWKRYKQYTRQDISAAIDAVQSGMSAVQAARRFGVPSRTLYDKVKKLGIQTSRPPKRTSTNGANSVAVPTWLYRTGNANGTTVSSARSEVENENNNTSVPTAVPLEERTSACSNVAAEDTSQDDDSTSDTTTPFTRVPVILSDKPKLLQHDEVEDLSVSRKSDIPIKSPTAMLDVVKSEKADSKSDYNELQYSV